MQLPEEISADFGAAFCECRKYRYALWRIWDRTKPLVMFVGLNPSTANEVDNDPTIRSVGRISKANGFGGFYMMNCFPYVSTDPEALRDYSNTQLNDYYLQKISELCAEVVFAWGSFEIIRELGRDRELTKMFPQAKALSINKNGSPKHPLYCKGDTQLVKWEMPPDSFGNDLSYRLLDRLGQRLAENEFETRAEERYVQNEYRKVLISVDPAIKHVFKKRRQQKAVLINEQMTKLLTEKHCSCGGTLRQARSGSKVCYCNTCDKRFIATSGKKKK